MLLFNFNYYNNPSIQETGNSFLRDAILSTCGVLLGIAISELLGYIRRKREINDVGESFLIELNTIQLNVPIQLKSIKEFAIQFHTKQIDNKIFNFIALLNTKRIDILDRRLVYKYFIKKEKNKEKSFKIVDELYASLEIIEYDSQMVKNEFDIQKLKLEEGTKQLELATRNITETIFLWLTENTNNGYDFSSDKFYQFIELAISPIIKKIGQLNVLKVDEAIFNPLIEKCIEHNKHPLVTKLFPLCISARDMVVSMGRKLNDGGTLMEAYAKSMEQEGIRLKAGVEKYMGII